jgi:membrane-associated protease RseP (regulator of RpoE activity)
VLLALTCASVYLCGGIRLVLGLVPILFAHEMGHYLACRHYGVDATLPFFIPTPWLPLGGLLAPWAPLSFVGTFGAVIRIRSPFPDRRSLFDIGIAGPLAGFVVCLPVLVLGVLEAQAVPLKSTENGFYLTLADPLLVQWAVHWLRGPVPEGQTLLIGQLGLAAWFGLFVTALNLIPIGQLDGGHVTYALFGRRAHALSHLVWWAYVAMMIVLGPSVILWVVLVRVLGFRHPPTLNDAAPLGRTRVLVALLGLLVFVICFLPNPFLLTWGQFGETLLEAWRELTTAS